MVSVLVRLINPYPDSTSFWLVGGTVAALGAVYLSLGPRLLAWGAGLPAIWGPLYKLLGGNKNGRVDEGRAQSLVEVTLGVRRQHLLDDAHRALVERPGRPAVGVALDAAVRRVRSALVDPRANRTGA